MKERKNTMQKERMNKERDGGRKEKLNHSFMI